MKLSRLPSGLSRTRNATARSRYAWMKNAAFVIGLAAIAIPWGANAQGEGEPAVAATGAQTNSQSNLQAGTLACTGKGGWGAIITSKKDFDCTFVSTNGEVRGKYKGTIRKFGLDLGVTGDTALTWLVLGPSSSVGGNYKEGSLAGNYVGAGVEAAVGVGFGANVLVGGSENHFTLQPVSIQVQTGIGVAAGVENLDLEYIGPMS